MDSTVNEEYMSNGAKEYLKKHAVRIGTQVLQNVMDSGDIFELKSTPLHDVEEYDTASIDHWTTGDGYKVPLNEYKMEDGSIVREAVQAWGWEGECMGYHPYIALENENGEWIEETKWPDYNFSGEDHIVEKE